MPRADDGARIWVESGGRGPHLALAHGGPGLWDYLGPLAGELEPFATVHRWDQRGAGRSDRRGPYSVARFVADMECVRAAVGARRWVAGGHSWGASLALAYAAAHPDRVRGVLYIAGIGVEWPEWVGAFREEHVRRLGGPEAAARVASLPEPEANRLRWTTDFASPGIAEPHVRRMLEAGFGSNREANRSVQGDFDRMAPGLLARVPEVPILVVQGELDPRPVAAADSLVRGLPAATVTRVVARRAGHFPWVEEPELVLGTIERWMASLGE